MPVPGLVIVVPQEGSSLALFIVFFYFCLGYSFLRRGLLPGVAWKTLRHLVSSGVPQPWLSFVSCAFVVGNQGMMLREEDGSLEVESFSRLYRREMLQPF